ncbi:coadhesin-like isoform X1 [Tigriopus californicus]|uniref:coadhesin-like isoform X1 n=1 Tax=Tigriopus californicus TaxID=6832 RepID=UPI0027DA18B8|nr:coadhesin-like isoform X1 [Tigriopus californicus]
MSIFMPLVTTLSLQCITTAEASKVFKFYGGEGCGVLEPFRILDRPQIDEPASKCTILESFSNQLTEQEINYIEEGIEPNEGWSEWNMWSQCTSTCGSGTKFRTRMCEEGKDCVGSTRHIKYCNPVFCPIDGGWGEWTSWGECSGTCGTTTMSRNRECSNPPMKHNGKPCPGQMKEFQQCEFLGPCPIHGAWTDWSSWTPCTKSCDSGLQSRNRSFVPTLSLHSTAEPAKVPPIRHKLVATDPCPIDGAWTTWSVWSSCTATCGPSNQARTRSCTNPEPQYGGIDCSGDTIESIICPTDLVQASWGRISR